MLGMGGSVWGATLDQPWATSPEGLLGVTPQPGVLCSLMGLGCSKVHLKILEEGRNTEYPEWEGPHRSPALAQDHPNEMPKPALRNGFAAMFGFSSQPQSRCSSTSISMSSSGEQPLLAPVLLPQVSPGRERSLPGQKLLQQSQVM